MDPEKWAVVDALVTDRLQLTDADLTAAEDASTSAGLPSIQVSPPLGKFLQLLARASGARTILEIGTLGGYSTIWLARALPPDGRLITLEIEPSHAEVARANVARAGLDHVVEIRIGPAADALAALEGEGREPFDFVFIDADKPSNTEYVRWAMRLGRVGTLIVVDNVVRRGVVVDSESDDPSVRGARDLYEFLSHESRLDATVLQTVGVKGYDGFAIALVTGE